MGRPIEVSFSGVWELSEEDVREAFQVDNELTNNELLELAEQLIDNLDSETLIKSAYIEAVFR
jgi:hypothetical protein